MVLGANQNLGDLRAIKKKSENMAVQDSAGDTDSGGSDSAGSSDATTVNTGFGQTATPQTTQKNKQSEDSDGSGTEPGTSDEAAFGPASPEDLQRVSTASQAEAAEYNEGIDRPEGATEAQEATPGVQVGVPGQTAQNQQQQDSQSDAGAGGGLPLGLLAVAAVAVVAILGGS